jgi:hypothetical protein
VSGETDNSGALAAEAQAERADAVARSTELREELAATDARRAEEELAKAQDAVADAEQEESKKERKRREAEQRKEAVAAEADRARQEAERARAAADEAGAPHGVTARPAAAYESAMAAGTEKPELFVAAAFAGAFLFARILRKIAE